MREAVIVSTARTLNGKACAAVSATPNQMCVGGGMGAAGLLEAC